MTISDEMLAHLKSGVTTLCRAWAVSLSDGTTMGFTDHDRDLSFEGIEFRADSGLTALALQQSTGLAVDNTEAIGALSDKAISETDIEAGKYDGAIVQCWQVNWSDIAQRRLLFRGYIGEIRRNGGAFEAELLGLADLLNQPRGRVFQTPCSAVLGDDLCRKDVSTPGYQAEAVILSVDDQLLGLDLLTGYENGWFARGVIKVLSGDAIGQTSAIKRDELATSERRVRLWTSLRAPVAVGDRVRLTAGCDKRLATCKSKFNNIVNFQGFPDIPGTDWTMAVPVSSLANGGSRR